MLLYISSRNASQVQAWFIYHIITKVGFTFVFYWQKLVMVLQSQFCFVLCYAWIWCNKWLTNYKLAGWGQREEERKLPGCLLTLLTFTDSYLIATVFVGSIHYGFFYIQHEFQAIIKIHVLWLYKVYTISGPYCFVTFC